MQLGRYRTRLLSQHGVSPEPAGTFLREVTRLATSKSAPGARLAGFYLGTMAKRRALLAGSTEKLNRLQYLAPAIRTADRTILFTQASDAADSAIACLSAEGIRGALLDGTMNAAERAEVLAAFEAGDHDVVAAPQLLDEGVDLPDADLAIVLAASRSRRQMIQRMGRVLRRKPDGRMARIVILFVEDTFEDPARGAHETFTASLEQAAREVRVFRHGTTDRGLVRWLAETTA